MPSKLKDPQAQSAQSERIVNTEHQQFLTVFEGIEDIVYVADPKSYELIFVNQAFERSFGSDVVGRKCYKVLQKRSQPCPFCSNHLIFGKHLGRTYTWEFQNEVTGRWFRCADKAIQWPDGRMVRFEMASDINWAKEAETRLEQQARALERSNRELKQFVYIASHHLQEPLRKVGSFLELLAERYHDQLDRDAHDFIDYAVDGSRRMKALINDLLTYLRIETRGRPVKPVQSAAVLEKVLLDLDPLVKEANATVRYDQMPCLAADETQLEQLFGHLIHNAIKYHGQEPIMVEISAEKIDKTWRFCVQDNGRGIEPRYQDRIFEIFQRLHGMTEYGGNGIGLAICKKIVQHHGGTIGVESTPGKGSTFYFTIPDFKEDI
jgi:signal transduction histidine kinase